MLESIYIGMSGLTAYAKGLQTISNNVANLNTPGFKTTTPQFADLYYGQNFTRSDRGTPHTMWLGSGVQYGYSSLIFSQGDLRASSGPLDLAIQGDGFLTLLDHGTARYLRTGQFTVRDDGLVVDKATGLSLAALAPSGGLVPLSMAGKQSSAPAASTKIQFSDNLSSGAQTVDPLPVTVYDSLGEAHKLTLNFKRDESLFKGRWAVTVQDENGTTLQEGALQFLGGLPEPGMDTFDFVLTSASGDASTITVDLSAITNFSMGSQSTLRISDTDGYAAGSLTGLDVDEKGQLVLTYSNGQKDTAGTIALARFSDPQRLEPMGNGLYNGARAPSPRYLASQSEGVGRLLAGASEASNVDLSTEFGSLILIQRGFQASSQVVSTANEMIMQLFQMRGQG